VTSARSETWYELKRSCPAIPLATDGTEQEREDLPPAMQFRVVEERGDTLVLESRASTATSHWRYLVQRADFEAAITTPGGLPRAGQAPTAPASTSGSPD
jgi:hypothetical protein